MIHYIYLLLLVVQSLLANRLSFEESLWNSPFQIASIGDVTSVHGEDALFFRGQGENHNSWYKVTLPNMDTTRLLDGDELYFEGENIHINQIKLSNSGNKMLIQTNYDQIWRYSHRGSYFIYDLKKKRVFKVGRDHHHLMNVKFAPNGEFVSYIKEDNNLYSFEIENRRERKLTNTGSNTILNGHFGWLYEEELSGYDAYRWSPDSRYIAFWQENQSSVKEYALISDKELYPVIQKIRYPKAGEINPTFKIGIVRAKGGGRRWLDLGEINEHYFPWMEWISDKRVAFLKMDRKQKNQILMVAEKETGKSNTIFMESDLDGWLDNHGQFWFLTDGRIIWLSEKSGYQHIHMAKHSGSKSWSITRGEWEVNTIKYIDEKNEKIYFTSNKESVFETRFYSIRFDGTDLLLLTPEEGCHDILITGAGNYFIDSYSSMMLPKRILLKNLKSGNLIKILDETDLNQFKNYEWSFPGIVHFPTEDGKEILDGVIILPPDYSSEKKYPVIMHGYGMPGTQIVWNKWGNSFHQYLAQNGYIVFFMDTRGMGGRGEKFKNLSYGDMAQFLAKDQLSGLNYLIEQGYADSNRIGAYGFSGGGYFTCLMMTKNGKYFKTGVAISPCTDYRLYNTAYTERFMGLPKENSDGYDSTSVISWINRMNGSLLLMHGTSDDNVHSQHTNHFIEAALAAKKDIEWYQYPGQNHGIYFGGAREHLYKKMVEYFKEKL